MNYLGIEKENLGRTVAALNKLLAEYHVYYQNLRAFHWNVEGQNFFDLHSLFEELYNDAKIKIDEVAERILTLRHRPIAHLSAYLRESGIEEAPEIMDDRKMVERTLHDHAILIQSMRDILSAAAEAGDEGTIDMIGGFLSELEKRSWMLDAWKRKKLVGALG